MANGRECVIINKLSAFPGMSDPNLNDDVLDFAKHLGFTGVDEDLFYESYYQLDNDDYEYDYDGVIEESYEGIS